MIQIKKTIQIVIIFFVLFFTLFVFAGIFHRPESSNSVNIRTLVKEGYSYYYLTKKKEKVKFTGTAYSFLKNSSAGLYNEKFSFRDGLLDGPYISFHQNENGQIKAKGFYVNGKKDGTFMLYDENGKIIEKLVFRNGEVIK